MTYTALIFDFDGTLFDTRIAIAATLKQTFVDFGLLVPKESEIWTTLKLGINLEKTIEMLISQQECNLITNMVVRYRELYNGGMGIEASRPFPGMPELLHDLADVGNTIVICSNKGRAAVEGTLAHFGLSATAALIVAADGEKPTKPDPASFWERIRPQIGYAASVQPMVIGDTEADIRYAQAIGAQGCWVTYGYGDPEVCRPLGPDLIVQDVYDLRYLLVKSGNLGVFAEDTHD
jgi:phosphoglycolate phosphatase